APGLAAGVVGLAAYDAGARPATGRRATIWPDLILARYPALLTFGPLTGAVSAPGRGSTPADARAALARATDWMEGAIPPPRPAPPAADFTAEAPPESYEAAVADVVARIASGELFQANIARAWTGALNADADPFDVF